MARIRTIKPNHVNDKKLSEITLPAHLFWVLSWCFSDDEGVMENDPLLLKSQIFPRRTDIRVEQVQQWIDQLVKARFIIPFTHEGEGYLLHRTFKTHQKIDRPNPSKVPSDIIRRTLDEHSTSDRSCIVEDSIVEVKEGKGSAGAQRFEKKLILIHPFSEKFLEAWVAWKNYKRDEHKFWYKSIETEQHTLNKLIKDSGENEERAIEMIYDSIARNWKGIFPDDDKKLKNGTHQQPTSKNGVVNKKNAGAIHALNDLKDEIAAER